MRSILGPCPYPAILHPQVFEQRIGASLNGLDRRLGRMAIHVSRCAEVLGDRMKLAEELVLSGTCTAPLTRLPHVLVPTAFIGQMGPTESCSKVGIIQAPVRWGMIWT